jgi:exopolysaccharide biosynthesis protein
MKLKTNIAQKTGRKVVRYSERIELGGGLSTKLHIVRYPKKHTAAKLIYFKKAIPLLEYCHKHEVNEAFGGGYFLRSNNKLLGDTWLKGQQLPYVPFPKPWASQRGSLHISQAAEVGVGPRNLFPKKIDGDLLQAGPTLVQAGVSLFECSADPDGFSETSYQHDQNLNSMRHPRAGIGCNDEYIWTVTADGRSKRDAGLYLDELADIFLALGADEALNLDGGSSSTHISNGRLINHPRTNNGGSATGFPIHTAIILTVK